MKNLIAKYRALVALALVAVLSASGCKPHRTVDALVVNAGVDAAVAEAHAHPLSPVTVKQAPPTHLFGAVKGKPIAWIYDPKLDTVSFVELKFGATGDNPAGWIIDPTTGALVAPSGKVIKGVSFLDSPAAVGTANLASLSGTQTVDGVSVTAGKKAWLFGQTTSTQDGCWIGNASAWTRCTELATGDDAAGMYFAVGAGTSNKGVWIIQNAAGAGIAGTNDLVGFNLNTLGGGGLTSPLSATLDFGANRGTNAADPSSAQDLATKNYVDTRGFRVACATTAALPAYTKSGSGVGATITANANGAFPTLDSTCTVNVGDIFYLVNGASTADNFLWVLNSAGGVSSTWNATRFVGADQAAELPGLRFSVRGGLLRGGGEYVYNAIATPVMESTHLFAHRTDIRITPLEGLRSRNDFTSVLTIGANANAPVPGNTEMLAITSGTASAMSSNVTNTSSLRGVYSFSSGTVATDVGGFQGGFTAAVTAPDGGDSIFISQDMGWDVTWVIAIPVLANGTDTFATNVGWSHTRNNSQKLPSDFVGLIYDETSGVTTTDWILAAAAGGVSTGTVTDTGITITAGQYYRIQSRKDPGDNTLRYWIDGVSAGTVTTNVPSIAVSQLCMSFKSVGIGNINFLRAASFSQDLDFPTGLTG